MCPIHAHVYHPYESLGEGYVVYLTIIWGDLSWFIMDLVYPVHWINPHLLDLADLLNSQWDYIPKFHPIDGRHTEG